VSKSVKYHSRVRIYEELIVIIKKELEAFDKIRNMLFQSKQIIENNIAKREEMIEQLNSNIEKLERRRLAKKQLANKNKK